MNPKLIVTAGLLRGSAFELQHEVTIGRETFNEICINDPLVSREHCLIRSTDEGLRIEDRNSYNGTLVNGLPIETQVLKHLDRISIGNTQFVFLASGEAPDIEGQIQFDDFDPTRNSTTIKLRPAEALYLDPERTSNAQFARNLATLLKLSRVINSNRDLRPLQRSVIECLFKVVPADYGAILLASNGAEEEIASAFGLNRDDADSRTLRLSKTIVDQVMKTGIAVCCNEIPQAGDLNLVESLAASKTNALLCVPLIVFEKTIGALYLSTDSLNARFDDEHLELTTALASIASIAIDNARHLERVENQKCLLQGELQSKHNMIGKSQKMRQVFEIISRVAATEATTLISGESGTGKELAARAIHQNSTRSQGPFIAINCAAITETLLESELFGHEKGAFTGASAQKKGKIELADGGTVFLDEIGELAPSLQAKLLRVLQERELERIGGTRPIKVDIRILAATNRDLAAAARSGLFREDLFYRLNVVSLRMPALRERREDIPLLAQQFIAKHSSKSPRQVRGITAETEACLLAYDWPGNVRELENTIERAIVLGLAEMIMPEDLPEEIQGTRASLIGAGAKYHEAVAQLKRKLILDIFAQVRGVHNDAARLLGIHPNNLYRMIRNLGLTEELKVWTTASDAKAKP